MSTDSKQQSATSDRLGSARTTAPGSESVEARTDRLFRALSSAPRREILRMLAAGVGSEGATTCCGPHDVCACTFAEQLGLGAPTVSHHMRVLKEAGLVVGEKRGLWVFYRLDHDALAEAFRLVQSSLRIGDSAAQ